MPLPSSNWDATTRQPKLRSTKREQTVPTPDTAQCPFACLGPNAHESHAKRLLAHAAPSNATLHGAQGLGGAPLSIMHRPPERQLLSHTEFLQGKKQERERQA